MFNYQKLASPHLREPMKDYVERGWLDDSFLRSLLSNQLVQTVQSADWINIEQIPQLCAFLMWEIPAASWGSPEIVRDWIACGGLEGLKKEAAPSEKLPNSQKQDHEE